MNNNRIYDQPEKIVELFANYFDFYIQYDC